MNTIKCTLILMILAILLSCDNTANQVKKSIVEHKSIPSSKSKEDLSSEDKRRQIEQEIKIDSLRLEIAMNDAFKIAKKAFKRDNFKKKYELQPDDSSFSIHIEISIGNLFNDSRKYFLLRRQSPWATYLDLFEVKNDRTEKLMEREQGAMTYIRDTIFDVNGDGFKDFLVHWYPASGCCERDIYSVYLNSPNKSKFAKEFEFINPNFFPKEKIIRGRSYGRNAPLYTFKWIGYKVDTIEFIYFPDPKSGNQFIRRKSDDENEKGEKIKKLPAEYEKLGYGKYL